MASTNNKGKKIKVFKTQLKWNDREERITRFLTTQMNRQTELGIKSYKQSKIRSNLVKSQEVKVTHGTTARVTCGMSVKLSWHGKII
jgi:hypothetical protein